MYSKHIVHPSVQAKNYSEHYFVSAIIDDEPKEERSPLKQTNGSPLKDSPVKTKRRGRRCRVIESDEEEEDDKGNVEAEQENKKNSPEPVKVALKILSLFIYPVRYFLCGFMQMS